MEGKMHNVNCGMIVSGHIASHRSNCYTVYTCCMWNTWR